MKLQLLYTFVDCTKHKQRITHHFNTKQDCLCFYNNSTIIFHNQLFSKYSLSFYLYPSSFLMNMDQVLVLTGANHLKLSSFQPIICHFLNIIRRFHFLYLNQFLNSRMILFHPSYETFLVLCLSFINMMLHSSEDNQKHKFFVLEFGCCFL